MGTDGVFHTEWDSPANPVHDLWTIVNSSEIVPGVLSPLLASWTCTAERDAFASILPDYDPDGRIPLLPRPVPIFAGVYAGRLALNVGFTAALLSMVDPSIGEAVLQGFFTGVAGTERFIVPTTEAQREATTKRIARIRAGAERKLARDRERLYAERKTDRFERDTRLTLRQSHKRQDQLTRDAIDLFRTHLHVTFAASEFQVRLAGVLAISGQAPELIVPLCSGLGEVESSKPAIHLYELARKARAWPSVRRSLTRNSAAAVLAKSRAGKTAEWKSFNRALNRFLYQWGYRVQGEYDSATPDWSEEPTFCISQVRTMLSVKESASPRALVRAAAQRRRALERQVRAAIPADLKAVYDEMLANAQRFTRMRELSKAVWIMGGRRGRATFLAMSHRLVDAGVIDTADDLTFLLYDEVMTLVGGGPVDDVRGRIARRRAQWTQADDYVLPDSWEGEARPALRPAATHTTQLAGLGVSGGTATGRARIVPDVAATEEREIEPGEVLVAPFTDAPWTPLFIPAGAVVVETGGVLSHAATVAREFGIPCVVMVKDATRIIRDGDLVTVDGVAGSVMIH